MSRPGSSESAAPSAPSAVERVPKVRLDVLTSRLLRDQNVSELPSPPSSSSSSLSSAASSTSLHDSRAATVRSAAAAESVQRIPLFAVARAEAQLQRPVALSSGGLAVDFTADDIRCITDGGVLRYLAAPAPSAMAAEMAALQREIDTFITAVDNEGRSYEIRMGAAGHKHVLIADDAAEGEDESAGVQLVEAAAPASPPPAAPAEKKPTSAPLTTSQRSGRQQPPQPKRRSAELQAQPSRLVPSPPPARTAVARTRAVAPPAAVTVRPQAALTDAEEARVEALMRGGAAVSPRCPNAFACSDDVVASLRELEERIRRYVDVRDGSEAPRSYGGVAQSSPQRAGVSSTTGTSAQLGNAYMRDAQQAAEAGRRLRSVNERLRALQRRGEALAELPADDTPAAVLALRPAWARPPSEAVAVPAEDEVQRLLALARKEEERARAAGLHVASPTATVNPYDGLRHAAAEARARAMAQLELFDSTPLALREVPTTPPSPLSDAGLLNSNAD